MSNPLYRKLRQFTRLSREDQGALDRLTSERVRHAGSRETILLEGDKPRDVNLILSGWACRYKQLEDGRRQIIAFSLPGDLCDQHVFILREMDHSIGTITPVTYAQISRDTMERIMLDHPRIMQALWWETLVNASIQREWTVNLGQRDAFERLGHLLCELFIRLRGIGLVTETSCDWPVTQADLGETTGLSTVHVNRTLQELRAAGLVTIKGKTLTIPNLAALQSATLFNPNYLHLEQEGSNLDANET